MVSRIQFWSATLPAWDGRTASPDSRATSTNVGNGPRGRFAAGRGAGARRSGSPADDAFCGPGVAGASSHAARARRSTERGVERTNGIVSGGRAGRTRRSHGRHEQRLSRLRRAAGFLGEQQEACDGLLAFAAVAGGELVDVESDVG